jgi:hypothetical protein
MNRFLSLLMVSLFIFSTSCDEKQNSREDKTKNEKVIRVKDPALSSYQVHMTGYDTTSFHNFYEKRIKPPLLNLNQSLDSKSVSELFLLKNSLLAMKGTIFEDAILDRYFKQQSWYQPPFWDERFEVSLNDAESNFITRIDGRIESLLQNNYSRNAIPNPENAYNLFQFSNLPASARHQMSQKSFIILDQEYDQPFDVYEQTEKDKLPPFISTDFILHQMHLFYGLLESEIEEEYLSDILKSMLEIINVELYSSYEKTLDPKIEEAIEESLLYYSIPYAVISGNKTNLIGNYNQIYFDELGKVLSGEGKGSKIMNDNELDFSIFKPFGSYSKNEQRTKYYKALTWLQKIDLCLSNEKDFSRAILIGYIISRSADLRNTYQEFAELKTYFSSQPEQFTFWKLADIISEIDNIHVFEDLYKESTITQIKESLQLEDQQECTLRVSLMPLEYQNLYTDLGQYIRDEANPEPEMLFAALGNSMAQKLASDHGSTGEIMEHLMAISKQEEARSIDWISTLLTSLQYDDHMPQNMQSNHWKMKQLNAALASWIQLNERVNISLSDMITTNNENDSTILRGYVEPNLTFYDACIILLKNTTTFFKHKNMLSERAATAVAGLHQILIELKSISHKELSGLTLAKEDYQFIASISTKCQQLIIQYLKLDLDSFEVAGDMSYASVIYWKNQVQNKVAGLGPAQVILVPVEIEGRIYITQGAVYSYYEMDSYPRSFVRQSEWNSILKQNKETQLQPFMSDYIFSASEDQEIVIASK